jgi:hypothetical protein
MFPGSLCTSEASNRPLKYGDADFFRYLALNPLFFHGRQRKLIELLTRREDEGMGEYPSFVGWDYARDLADLAAGGSNLVAATASSSTAT